MPNPYSPTLIAHFRAPKNRGSLPNPTLEQEGTNPLCGDRVRIELRVEEGIVRDAGFTANACAICVAAASMLTDLVRNAPLEEVETLTVDDLLKALKAEVPSSRRNCVRLPLTVMHTGVLRYRKGQPDAPASPPLRDAPVAAIVLAAGQARRFGAQKLVAPLGDSTVIGRVIAGIALSSVKDIIVVVGPHGDAVRNALRGVDVQFAVNDDPARGMASSVATGIDAVPPDDNAAVVILGDQPTVDETVLQRLVGAWRAGHRSIVAPRYRGRRGNPVLFDRAVFGDLRALEGDRGARDYIDAYPSRVEVIDFDEPAPIDIDTPGDYQELLRGSKGEGRAEAW